MLRVVVVGGGIAGLATAALLSAEGHTVTLLEKNDVLGGRVGSIERNGFRFDTGPSWYLMPEVFDRFFSLLGTSTGEQLDLLPLDPSYRVFFEGSPSSAAVDVRPDPRHNRALFESLEPGAGEGFDRYLASADQTYQLALRHFLYSNFDSPRSVLNHNVLRRAPQLLRLLTQSMGDHIASRFSSEKIRQILGYPAVFLGSSPARAPSMYHLMSHLDLGGAVLYPQGGFTRLIKAIADLAHAHGVRIRTGATVQAIHTNGHGRAAHVSGVSYTHTGDKHLLEAEVVVGAADMRHLETTLLPRRLQTHPHSAWQHRSPGPSAVLALLGVNGPIPQLPHHSLFFTADWRQNFGDIFGPDTRIPDPASIYVCKPSHTDPTVAPPGTENLFVLIPVPADPSIGPGGPDGSGARVVEQAVDRAIDQISTWAGVTDLRGRIRVRHTIGPADFVVQYNSWRGGALGLEHSLRQSAFLRPSNVSSKVGGLLYAGASTVPGVGLPMCLISAELVQARLRGEKLSGLAAPGTRA